MNPGVMTGVLGLPVEAARAALEAAGYGYPLEVRTGLPRRPAPLGEGRVVRVRATAGGGIELVVAVHAPQVLPGEPKRGGTQ